MRQVDELVGAALDACSDQPRLCVVVYEADRPPVHVAGQDAWFAVFEPCRPEDAVALRGDFDAASPLMRRLVRVAGDMQVRIVGEP